MFFPSPGTKQSPERRWALGDRAFFAHGACHILAGVYLCDPPLPGFWAERIVPHGSAAGNHIYLTNGTLSFDYRGYANRDRLRAYHAKKWNSRHPGWDCNVAPVDFDLLDTNALNARKMRGPDQYHADPIPRARTFLNRIDHTRHAGRAP